VLDSRHRLSSDYGRAVFALADRLRAEVELELAIDAADGAQVAILAGFCGPRAIEVHAGDARTAFAGRGFDAVECVMIGEIASRAVLEAAGELPILYTPGPPGSEDPGLVRRAAVVLCRSRAQATEVRSLAPGAVCVQVPPGGDFETFEAGRFEREPTVVAAGERGQLRDRFGRVAEAFAAARRRVPDLRLTVLGSRPALETPDACEVVTDTGVRARARLLREAAVLLWLGDEGHSCAPAVVEALASGTPAVVSDLAGLRHHYRRWPAVAFAPPDDAGAVGEELARAVRLGPTAALVDREAARAVHDWDVLARSRAAAVRGAIGTAPRV